MRLSWFRLLAIAALAPAAVGVTAAEPARLPKPNILLIVADNLGYGDVACYGCPDIRTPVIDHLASEGVRFTNFYGNGPECTPTRTALLTGRYQQRAGGLECAIGTGNVGRYDDAIRLAEQGELGLPGKESTLVWSLKDAGYQAVGFGKWHLGYEAKFLPPRHGFDDFLSSLGGTVDYFYHNEPDGTRVLYENDQPAGYRGRYMTDLLTDKALEFLAGPARQKPFFLYLPYTAPSAPHQHPDHVPAGPKLSNQWDSSDWQAGTREVFGLMVERLDQSIGKVLEAIDQRGFRDNTLVIFASDNGGYALARNAPFRGGASELFEGGIRVPCIIRWPGVLPEGNVDHRPGLFFDLSASILQAAGARVPPDRKLDGIDLIGQVAKGQPADPRPLFWRARRADRTWRAVREGTLKYVSRQDGDQFEEFLFNLSCDPGEEQNLLVAQPEDAARLKKLLANWEADVKPAR